MKRLLLVLVIVALAAPLAAQEKTEVSAFFDDPGAWHSSDRGTGASSGYGVSLRYFATPQVSLELSVARHDRRFAAWDVSNPAVPVLISEERARLTPIDLIASHHFATDGRWKPYIGGGLHYLSISNGLAKTNRLDLVVAGGVAFNVTQHFFLRAEGKVVPDGRANGYEEVTHGLLGVGWRF